MGRFLIDIPTARAPESRTIFGQKPTDMRQAYMAALAARQGIGLLGDIAPSAKTVGDIKRAFLKATPAPTQQAPQPAAPTDAIVPPGTPIPDPAEVAAFRRAQQQHRQQQALMRSEGLQQAAVAGVRGQVVGTPQMLADAVGAVNAAQTPEQLEVAQAAYERALSQVQPSQPLQPAPDSGFNQNRVINQLLSREMQPAVPQQPAVRQQPAASQRLVKESAVAPTDAASALLLAKAAAASGNAQEFRNALLAARTVDVSDMPEQDVGDLFSDAGKRQRLVKMMLGLRTQRVDPLARRKLDVAERRVAATEVGLGIRGKAEARRLLAEKRKQKAQNVLLDAQKKYLEGKTALNDVTKRTKEKLLALGLPEKQVNLVVARMKSALQSAKESRWRMDPKRHAERKELKSLTKPMQINIGAYQKKADIRRKEDAKKAIIKLEGQLKKLRSIQYNPQQEASKVWYRNQGKAQLDLEQKKKHVLAEIEGVKRQLELYKKVAKGQDVATDGPTSVDELIGDALSNP